MTVKASNLWWVVRGSNPRHFRCKGRCSHASYCFCENMPLFIDATKASHANDAGSLGFYEPRNVSQNINEGHSHAR
jgi:hypothetical protein